MKRENDKRGFLTGVLPSDDSGELTIEVKDPLGVWVGQHIRLAIREQGVLVNGKGSS